MKEKDSCERLVREAFRVKHREFGDVLLTRATVIGDMQSGKSTVVNSIISKINEIYDEYEQVNIKTSYYGEIHKIHTEERYRELYEKVKNAEIINIFIDDALASAHTHRRKKVIDVDFANIRHYFEGVIGDGCATVNIFFATQRYQLLSPFMRKAPILIVKPLDINFFEDKGLYVYLGKNYAKILKEYVYKVLIEKDKSVMEKVIIKLAGKPSAIYTLKKRENVFYHLLESTGDSENIYFGKVLDYLRREMWPCSYAELSEEIGVPVNIIKKYILAYKKHEKLSYTEFSKNKEMERKIREVVNY